MSRYNKNRESNVDAQGFRVATGKSSSRGGRGRGGGRGGARGGGRPPATMNSRFAAFAMEQQQQMDGSGSEYHVRGETAGSSGQVFTERVQIPYGSAAYVIGKSGANVKRMMQMGAKCSVKDTVVHIQSSSRSQCQAAKKMVFDLLKSYNSRKQTQVNTLNLLAVGESVGALDNVLSAPKKHVPKVDLQEREGPLNSFEKIGEERTYFELKVCESVIVFRYLELRVIKKLNFIRTLMMCSGISIIPKLWRCSVLSRRATRKMRKLTKKRP